ncbi:MAG: IreB family regulatory phosphoprotein [Firmicutes bacterium]|nr:IreB family regulatory phosphoprotein [Bacillota bacterium]
MDNHTQETVSFRLDAEESNETRTILVEVFTALKEKGYNPINQIVGYLISGDPAYITSHRNARSLIRKLERDDILEELVTAYLQEVE